MTHVPVRKLAAVIPITETIADDIAYAHEHWERLGLSGDASCMCSYHRSVRIPFVGRCSPGRPCDTSNPLHISFWGECWSRRSGAAS